jgi:hypothetical protein
LARLFTDRRATIAAGVCAFGMLAAAADAQVFVPYGYPPPYQIGYGEPLASVRLDVKPKEAEVYVDGYYAGIVDDFDGVFQRLHVTAGAHQIVLYHDGYRSAKQQVYLSPDNTFKIKYQMEKLAPGEIAEARPVPPPPPPMPAQQGAPLPQYGGRRGGRPPFGPRGANQPPPNQPPTPEAPPPLPGQAQGNGTISLHVQPADSEVLVDGQAWRGPSGPDRILIDTSAGSHTIQIRKTGYVGYVTDVQVAPGETATLDVNLRRVP